MPHHNRKRNRNSETIKQIRVKPPGYCKTILHTAHTRLTQITEQLPVAAFVVIIVKTKSLLVWHLSE